MESPFDTIVAPITAPGRAAVAAVRVSGPNAYLVARATFPSLPLEPEPRKAIYGWFRHGDDGLALPFSSDSYTGEPCVELFIHGSPTSVRMLMDDCLAAGARLAGPGEFTLRAFANGRIDLSQAEAVAETVDAQTQTQLKAAGGQLAGALARALQPALDRVEETIVLYEATLDFSEEIGPINSLETVDAIRKAEATISEVLQWERPTQLVREGLRVALVGRPNAGKSSLFNRLAGSDRAIVTPIPGTTRDVLETTLDVRGIPVTLFDTAGLRSKAETVEQIGIQRAISAARHAHVILYLYDCQIGLIEEDTRNLHALESPVLIATKADLPHSPTKDLEVSAETGDGLTKFLDQLVDSAAEIELPYLLNPRHTSALRNAQNALGEAIAGIGVEAAPELILPALYHATGELRQILGLGVAPDVLDQIFAKFCIGK
jgi:tRNA modification GTPase